MSSKQGMVCLTLLNWEVGNYEKIRRKSCVCRCSKYSESLSERMSRWHSHGSCSILERSPLPLRQKFSKHLRCLVFLQIGSACSSQIPGSEACQRKVLRDYGKVAAQVHTGHSKHTPAMAGKDVMRKSPKRQALVNLEIPPVQPSASASTYLCQEKSFSCLKAIAHGYLVHNCRET